MRVVFPCKAELRVRDASGIEVEGRTDTVQHLHLDIAEYMQQPLVFEHVDHDDVQCHQGVKEDQQRQEGIGRPSRAFEEEQPTEYHGLYGEHADDSK